MSLNSITIMGRITKDIELRNTPSGTAVTNFTVAVNRDYEKDKTDFLDCVAWRDKAEFAAKYFGKGRMVAVIGTLQIREWTDKDGNKRKSAEIVVNSMYFADSKKQDSGDSYGGYTEIEDGGDVPF